MNYEICCVHKWCWVYRWGGPLPSEPIREWDSECKRCNTLVKNVKKEEFDPMPRVVVGRLEPIGGDAQEDPHA